MEGYSVTLAVFAVANCSRRLFFTLDAGRETMRNDRTILRDAELEELAELLEATFALDFEFSPWGFECGSDRVIAGCRVAEDEETEEFVVESFVTDEKRRYPIHDTTAIDLFFELLAMKAFRGMEVR